MAWIVPEGNNQQNSKIHLESNPFYLFWPFEKSLEHETIFPPVPEKSQRLLLLNLNNKKAFVTQQK